MSTIQAAVMTEPGTIELREFPNPRNFASANLIVV